MAAPEIVTSEAGALDPERRLATLARAAGPLRRVIAALAGRLVADRGGERLGYARLGDYARERLGLSARSLQELARVDRGLTELSRLEAALVSGRLPWSKVRLLARFATHRDEARWIEYARRVSVRVLEGEVRAVDRGAVESGALAVDESGAELDPTERIRIGGPAALCFKWQRTKEYASRVAGERVSPGTLLEMVTAEALSALPLAADAEAEAVPTEGTSWSEAVEVEGGVRPPRGVPVPAAASASRAGTPKADTPDVLEPDRNPPGAVLPAFLRPLMEGLAEADPFELDARLRRAVRLEQRLDAEIAPLLRQVSASEYAWRIRFRTLAAYARERLGMSPRKARALVRLERVGDVCPELRAAYRDGCLSWVQAQALAPLLLIEAEGDWRRAWVAWAERISVRRLEELVDRALVLRETDPAAWTRCREHPERMGEDSEQASDDAGRQTCARPTDLGEGWHLSVTAPRDVVRLFRAVLCTLRRAVERETGRLPSEGEGLEAMLDHALRSWGVDDVWLRRRIRRSYPVFERDGWRCTVPGCTSRRNLHAHHIVFRSAGGGNDLENQTTLCAYHHQRGVHAGIVRIRGRAPQRLSYELGVRAGRAPLVRYRSGDRLA